MLCTNNSPWSSSPHAPIIPLEIPNPLLSPRTVFATLPPAKVLTFEEDSSSPSSSWLERTWLFTFLSIFSSSTSSTYHHETDSTKQFNTPCHVMSCNITTLHHPYTKYFNMKAMLRKCNHKK